MQGSHQVAQKSTTTTLPLSSSELSVPPEIFRGQTLGHLPSAFNPGPLPAAAVFGWD